uniref:Ypt/Rab-GAP domain of gyp1p superfamily protein isoform 1 n=2 Tax=Hirondellea gigas TaxID=1518452 RepID=A0A6A7G6Q1_9CRUS
MEARNLDLELLRKLCWKGIPPFLRTRAWKLLLGYLPSNLERRVPTLKKRRGEYRGFIDIFYNIDPSQRTEQEQKIYTQIVADVPRTNPEMPLFQEKCMQQCLTRVLYIWSIRHPATGYVQGINDLATPFIYLFFGDALGRDFSKKCADLDDKEFFNIEADTFWCLSKLLEGIQDHYIFAQPGLQRMVFKLKELIHRHDEPLHDHLQNNNLMFIQFAFRWMNCLLLREIPLHLIIRLWDTYLSSGDQPGLTGFHIYTCAALIEKYSSKLLKLDFQELVIFLQHIPTHQWNVQDIESLVSQAYILQSLYHDAQSHLR